MKCPICSKGTMQPIESVIEEDGVPFAAYRCTSCGEELLTMTQLHGIAENYRKLRAANQVTFAKWGSSVAVRIPKAIAQEYHIASGTQGILTKEKKGFRIIPLHE